MELSRSDFLPPLNFTTGSLSLKFFSMVGPGEETWFKKDLNDMERRYGETTEGRLLEKGERNLDYTARRRLFANIVHRG